MIDVLLSNFHLRPLAPHLGQLIHSLEVHLSRFQEDFASAVNIFLSLTRGPAFLVELGKVDVQTMEIGGRSARADS